MPASRFRLAIAALGVLLFASHAGPAQPAEASGKPLTTSKATGVDAMNHHARPSTLKVPGARIYYEVRGRAPCC